MRTLVGVMPLLLGAMTVQAQDTARTQAQGDATTTAAGLEEVLVTAARREQTVQQTAIPVTAISADMLATQGVTSVVDLTRLAPAVKIGQNAGAGVQITVRGVGNFGGNGFAEPGVAVNLDGVYLSRSPGATGIFYDVQRVEILKGPQGTLYGRNSTGGVVNVITNDPTDELESHVAGEIGNYGLYRGSVALNLPISEGVAVRFAGQGVTRDGFLSDGYDDEEGYSARVKLKLDPTEDLSILLSGDIAYTKGNGSNAVWVPYVLPSDPFIGPSDPRANNAVFGTLPPARSALLPRITDQGYLDNKAYGLQATIDYDLDFAAATLILARRVTGVDYLHYSAGFPVWDDNRDDPSETNTAELRFSSSSSDRLKWVVGGFYFDDDLHTRISPDQGVVFSRDDTTVLTESWSVFGEATYSLTDRLRVTAGGRYTSDDKEISGSTLGGIASPPVTYAAVCPAALGSILTVGAVRNPADTNTFPATCTSPVAGQETFDEFTWKLGAEYDIAERSLVYATVATGFKGGGFYSSLNTAPEGSFPNNAYRPETLRAYTLGSKNRFLDNSLQVNLETFYWDYQDKQIPHAGLVQPGNNINLVVDNAASARIYGAEIESLWRLSGHNELAATVQYIHSNYGEFEYDVVVPAFAVNPNATPDTGCAFTPVIAPGGPGTPGISTVDCSGRQVPYAPEWVINLGYRHTFDLPNGSSLVAGAGTQYESAFWIGEEYLSTQRQDSFTMSNADLTWKSPLEKYSVAAYIRNIEDEAVGQTGFLSPQVGRALIILRPPRTYGVRFSANF